LTATTRIIQFGLHSILMSCLLRPGSCRRSVACAHAGLPDTPYVSAAVSTDGGPATRRERGASGWLPRTVHRMAKEPGIRHQWLRGGSCRRRAGPDSRFRDSGRAGAQAPARGVVCLPGGYAPFGQSAGFTLPADVTY